MKKTIQFISMLLIMLQILMPLPAQGNTAFTDVPSSHWAFDAIHGLRNRGVTDGVGNNQFGLGKTIKRSEFTAFLVKLMQWELLQPITASFLDVDNTKWYYPYIETALAHGVIIRDAESFRAEDPITREEMAIMIVRTLGLDTLAGQLSDNELPFSDVKANAGHITIAKDFGIITGIGNNLFKPNDNAKREEAAAMMMRMVNKLDNGLKHLHAFYAIRSANQMEMLSSLDSVGFGWSRVEYDLQTQQVVLNLTNTNQNEYAVPLQFAEPLNKAVKSNASTHLMVFVRQQMVLDNTEKEIPLTEYILTDATARKQVLSAIVQAMSSGITVNETNVSFDGVVIDFENLSGETLKNSFNTFLAELKAELVKLDKELMVAVHPIARPGQAYFDAYDYKTIGELADRVVLMAHDYYAKQLTDAQMEQGYTLTPLTPYNDFYYALKAITDKTIGVQDLSKISVQISFDAVQWKLKEGKIINRYPYQPGYDTIAKRIVMEDVTIQYSTALQNPYATFYDQLDGTDNVIWYEDARSVQAKVDLMKMFGIEGISLWRLGNIPDYRELSGKVYLDVWQKILENMKTHSQEG